MTNHRAATAAFGAAGMLTLGIGVTGCAVGFTSDPAAPRSEETRTSKPPTGEPRAAYRDGEYEATGWYGSLPSHQDVTLTIEDGTVTAVEITTPAEDDTSLGYQQRFAEALPGAVVGRNLDEISFDRLAGSSGCSEGFMDALGQIKQQAGS